MTVFRSGIFHAVKLAGLVIRNQIEVCALFSLVLPEKNCVEKKFKLCNQRGFNLLQSCFMKNFTTV